MKVGTAVAVLCFLFICAVQIYSIQQSASSTAALGYLILPIAAVLLSAAAFLMGWLWGMLVPLSATARGRLPRLIVACAIGVLAATWTVSELVTWWKVRSLVSQVGQMTGEQLDSLIAQPGFGQNRFVLGAIAESPRATAGALHRIALMNRRDLYEPARAFLPVPSRNRKGIAVMRLVAAHRNTSPEDLNWLATHSEDEYLLGDLARRSELDADIIRRLARSGKGSIEYGLASNPKAPADILLRLTASTNEYTRANVAANSAAPSDALRILSTDPAVHVRARLATNPSSPDEVVRALASDRDDYVRRLAVGRRQ